MSKWKQLYDGWAPGLSDYPCVLPLLEIGASARRPLRLGEFSVLDDLVDGSSIIGLTKFILSLGRPVARAEAGGRWR